MIDIKAKATKWLNNAITDETTKAELDIISYLKKLIKEDKEIEEKPQEVQWKKYFDYLWKIYPRKVGRLHAIKQYEKKIRGLSEEETKAVSNAIYAKIKKRMEYWNEHETELCYIPHFSSFLNSEIENSKNYKGK